MTEECKKIVKAAPMMKQCLWIFVSDVVYTAKANLFNVSQSRWDPQLKGGTRDVNKKRIETKINAHLLLS